MARRLGARLVLAAFAATSLAGCRRSTPPSPTAAQPSASSPTSAAVGAASPSASGPALASSAAARARPPLPLVTAFEGAEGGTLLHLERDGDALRGHLVDGATLAATALRGAMLDGRRFALDEAARTKRPVRVEGEVDGGRVVGAVVKGGGGKPRALKPARAAPPDASRLPERGFRGTVGELAVRAQLAVEGTRVTGFYRYGRSRDDLRLDGSYDPATGKFAVQETGPRGEVVGGMQGVFLSPNHLAGRWESPDGARGLPLWLELAEPLERVQALPGGAKLVPREARKELGPHCLYAATYPELEGLADRAAQGALNRALRPAPPALGAGDCEGATADIPYEFDYGYSIASKKRRGALSVEFHHYAFSGGAHGSGGTTCEVLDLKGGKRRALGELLAPGARATLSALATSKLRAEHKVVDLTEAGFFERDVKVGEAPNLCLLDDKVRLRFAVYEVAPYVMGETEVELSFAELRPLMANDPWVDELLR